MRTFWIVSLSVVVLGGVFCATQWKRWFGNAPEEHYVTTSIPDRITITFGENSATQRVVSWRCDSILQPSFLRLARANDTVCCPALGKVVYSRAGCSAYYRVALNDLQPATYFYQVCTNDVCSSWYSFSTFTTDSLGFVLLGDVQDVPETSSKALFSAIDERFPQADFWAFSGDIIERPTDFYWQLWFADMQAVLSEKPIISCAGNHESLKGVYKKIDSRWTSIFGHPQNGHSRWLGRSYFIDFQQVRYIVLDTEALQSLSDYTIANAWLKSVLRRDSHQFKVVMMHHPVYAAGIGRFNLLIYLAFANVLSEADLVLQGHDHSYARRSKHTIEGRLTTPVHLITTASDKHYLSKCSAKAEKIACGHRLYQYIRVTNDTLRVQSFLADNHQLYDDFAIVKKENNDVEVIDFAQSLPEMIDLPERYQQKNTRAVQRFKAKRAARLQQKSLIE